MIGGSLAQWHTVESVSTSRFHMSHMRPRESLGQALVSSGTLYWLHPHSYCSHVRSRGSLGQAVANSNMSSSWVSAMGPVSFSVAKSSHTVCMRSFIKNVQLLFPCVSEIRPTKGSVVSLVNFNFKIWYALVPWAGECWKREHVSNILSQHSWTYH